ncbi:uncharacterized protein [Ambystoma mexicanum]|uniref:uncharacterized protein n=1 Tax=Ambystoma mexicanum TaxID=8296 RepID=UPI0037E8EB68
MQPGENGVDRSLVFASWVLSATEQRYSHIERETLAVLQWCRNYHQYIYGKPVKVITDHKPLILIVTGSSSKPPARIEKLLLALLEYDVELTFRPGVTNAADYLSHHPIPSFESTEEVDTEEYINSIADTMTPTLMSIDNIRKASVDDDCLRILQAAGEKWEWRRVLEKFEARTTEARTALKRMGRGWPPLKHYFNDARKDFSQTTCHAHPESLMMLQYLKEGERPLRWCTLDKHKVHLSAESQVQVRVAQETLGLTFRAFSRAQYDALRRLRSYWVPRFLIHRQRSLHRRDVFESGPFSETEARLTLDARPLLKPFKSLPTNGDGRMSHVKKSHDSVTGLRLDKRDQDACPDLDRRAQKTPLLGKLLSALERDREAGSTFLHYLSRFESAQMVHSFLLWRELEDYRGAEAMQVNPHLLHRAAWDIHNKYLRRDAPCAVGLSLGTTPHCHDLEGMPGARLGGPYALAFRAAAHHTLGVLRVAWLRYLSYDISNFLK